MAVTRTARGSATSKTSGSTLQIAAQSLTAGHLLVVYLAYDDQTLTSVFWGTQQLTLGDAVLGAGVRTRIAWCVADATASRTITATWAAPLVAKAMVADSFSSSVAGMIPLTRDTFNATNAGTGTTASTAAMGAIVGGTESVTVGVVGTEGPSGDTAGTFAEPNTAGQRVGTTGNPAAGNVTVSSAYRLGPTAGTTPALSKTGMTSRDWGAAIRHFYWANAFSRTVTDTVAIGIDNIVAAIPITSTLAPDVLIADNMGGTLSAVDEPVDTPDGSLMTHGPGDPATAHFGFPTPDGPLTGQQRFRIRIVHDNEGGIPMVSDPFATVRLDVYENGVLRFTGTPQQVQDFDVTHEFAWDASVLSGDGSAVEAFFTGSRGVNPSQTDFIVPNIDAIEWVAKFLPAAGGSATRFPSESLTVSDTVGRILVSSRLHSDTTSLTESPSRQLAAARPLSESIASGADSIVRILAAKPTVSDTYVLPTESLARVLTAIRGPPDTVTTTEDIVRRVGIAAPISDWVSVGADAITRVLSARPTVSDTIAIGVEALVRILVATRTPSDIVGLTDEFDRATLAPWSSGAAIAMSIDGSALVSALAPNQTAIAVIDIPHQGFETLLTGRFQDPSAGPVDKFIRVSTSEFVTGPCARLRIRASGEISVEILNNSSLVATFVFSGSYTAGATVFMRARFQSGVVQAAAWLDGSPEPPMQVALVATSPGSNRIAIWHATGSGGSGTTTIFTDAISIYPVASTANGLARLPSDTTSVSDTVSRIVAAKRQLTETLTTTDSISHVYVQHATRTAADTTTLTDDLSRALVAIRGPPDTVTTTDEIAHSTVAQHNRTADDTTSVTDSLDQLGVFTRSAVDTTAVTDVINQGLVRRADDSVSTADTIVGSGTYTRPIADTTAVTDDASRLLTAARQADDTTSASDALDRQIAAARAANDTVSTADSIEHTHDVGSVNFPRSAGDTTVVTDSVDPHGTFTREATDSVSIGTDSIDTGQGARQREAIDTLSTSDSVVAQLTTVRTAAETTTTTESISQVTAVSRAVDDTITTTDSVEALSSASTAVTDTVTTTDTAARTVAASRATADSSTATDSLVRRLFASRPIADTTSATDDVAHSTSRSNQRALEDTTSQIDALATHLDATRRPADVVSGADSLLHAQAITRALSDSTTVTDAVAGTNAATGSLEDSTSLTDDVTRSLNAKRGLSEAIPTSDTTGGAQAWSRTLTDTVSGTDVALVRQRAIPAVVSSAHSTRNRASAQVVVRDARNIHRAETVVRSRTSAQSEVDSDA
jgi:hypothetical protein